MLLELAIGDAYGAGFEYVDRQTIETHNDAAHYIAHPRHCIGSGRYTDDTQMSLAIAEAIVSGEDWTPLNLASRFVEVYRRDPRGGYAGRFQEFLGRVESGEQFLREIIPTSPKSGAAMRATPIGVYPAVEEVLQRCTAQARLTHDTPEGVAAAQASSLMTHYFLYGHGPKSELGAFLEEYVLGFPWSEPWRGKVRAFGWMSVRAAVTAVMENETMTDLLRACIAFSGDVDTVATIALAAGSCCPEIRQDLPGSLVLGLENGAYGRDYLVELDRRLMALVGGGR